MIFLLALIASLDDSHKGQLDIIKLARQAKSKALDIGFVMVGTGRDELLLKKKARI
jgi:hypothetical protein